jgi:hypothetical protein
MVMHVVSMVHWDPHHSNMDRYLSQRLSQGCI